MPSLDLKVWVEETETGIRIMHEHYMKDVSSKSVVHAMSALPWTAKRTVLTQEGLLILLNCSRGLPWLRKAQHLTHLAARMQYSGYDKEFRYGVIASAINAYTVLRSAEDEGQRPLYRPREWNADERRIEEAKKKKNWYKKGGFESVIFVPSTPNSTLRKQYEQCIKTSDFKIKVVEKAGVSLKRMLQKSDPFRDRNCDRLNCFICQSGGTGSCRSEAVNYDIVCKECESPCYRGETSINAYARGLEHVEDLEKKLPTSVMNRHSIQKHNGLVPEFQMNMTGTYVNDAMLRQITEAVQIRRTPSGKLANSKDEWNYLHLLLL